jgi:O-antigen/teichoic acid export membrane protein
LKKIKNLYKTSFTKNVMMITGGTAFAQTLSILLSPIITRIYSPEEYGVLTIYMAILGMINLLGALSYDSAIPIADDDYKAINILGLCIIILVLLTSIILIVMAFFGMNILQLINAEILCKYRYFIAVGFFFTGLYTILTNWAFRKKNFKSIAKTKLSQSIASNITKIGLGLLSLGPIGLILGAILGQGAGIITLAKPLIKLDLLRNINKNDIKWSIKRYIKFPLYSAPSLFLISFSSQLPVIFISNLYGPDIVGFYGLAYSITFLPMTFIGKSIQDVFYGEAASIGRKNPEQVKKLSNKLLKKLILIGLVPMATLVCFGPLLFSFIFGDVWYEAGVYSRFLTLFVFSHLIFQPISVVFSIFEQQKKSFFLNLIKLIMVLVVFGVTKLFLLDSYGAILLFSAAMSIIELFKYLLAQKTMDDEINKSNSPRYDY